MSRVAEDAVRLHPMASIRVAHTADQSVEVAFGEGSGRVCLSFDDADLAAWLLNLRKPTARSNAIATAVTCLRLEELAAARLVDSLRQEGLLINPASSPLGERAADWTRWGWRDALDFHRAARDLAFEYGDNEGWERQIHELEEWVAQSETGMEPPSPGPYYQRQGIERVSLPRGRALIDARSFGEVLHARRSYRDFNRRPIPLAHLAAVLEHAHGATGTTDMGPIGEHLLKTSPSGGARHPIEAYVVAMSVDGLTPGLYHYDVRDHALNLLSAGDFGERIWELSHRQRGTWQASIAVFHTVRWARHMWKYRYARSYRMVMYDAAHLVQTHLLTATAVGLRTFLTPAIQDSLTEAFLGIEDPEEESVLYLTALG